MAVPRPAAPPPLKIADLRTDYKRESLDLSDVAPAPFAQFGRWFEAAVSAAVPEPNAMTLATVDASGRPTARVVLLKGFDERGFVFYTNYASRKGAELAAHPDAALNFFWPELERQIRIEGAVAKVSDAESAEYFASRPRLSQIGAWASPQSEPIADRQVLESRFAAAEARYRGEVPRPAHWGGYRLDPVMLEFWQGRPSRLHDRIRYRRSPADPKRWDIDRLAP